MPIKRGVNLFKVYNSPIFEFIRKNMDEDGTIDFKKVENFIAEHYEIFEPRRRINAILKSGLLEYKKKQVLTLAKDKKTDQYLYEKLYKEDENK